MSILSSNGKLIEILIKAKDEASRTLSNVSGNVEHLDKKSAALAATAKYAARAVAVVGTAVAAGGVAAVVSAGSYEQQTIAFETMLGSADKAHKMMKDISDFAMSTPFELPEVVQASKQLLAFGIAQDKVLPTMRKLGDVAAGVSVPVGQIGYAYGQVRVAGKLMATELLQFTNAGVPMIEYLSKVLKKPQEEIRKLVEQGKVSFDDVDAAFTLMTQSGGRFDNMMDRQSHTFSGVVSNIKDGFGQILRASVGVSKTGEIMEGGFFDRIKSGAEQVMPWMQKIADKIGGITGATDDMVESLGTGRYEMSLMELATGHVARAKVDVANAEREVQRVESQAPAIHQAVANARGEVVKRQQELNDAVERYGPNSDEAMEATLRLEDAQARLNGQLRDSAKNTLEVTTAKGRLRDANNDLAGAMETLNQLSMGLQNKTFPGLIRSMSGVEVQAVRSAQEIQGALGVTEGAQYRLNGKIGELQSTSSSVTKTIMSNFGTIQAEANTLTQKLNQMPAQTGGLKVVPRAHGGPVQAGMPYAVGDNPDGSWNSTTELFVPRQSGTIVPAAEVQKALGQSGRGGVTVNQTNHIYNQIDLEFANLELGWRLANA